MQTTTDAPREIVVELEARETEWEYAPGRKVMAWGFDILEHHAAGMMGHFKVVR